MHIVYKTKLKKNDHVQIVAGKNKGKSGRLILIDRTKKRGTVEGVNMIKKTVKARSQNEKGSIREMEGPLDLSNLMIVCKKCGPVRLRYKINDDKTKVRVCVKCGEVI